MSIPIQNIYYLLCYAWNKLDERDFVDVNNQENIELVDLFAKVLSKGTARLLKQGLDRYYVEKEDEVTGVKGKLIFGDTLKRNLLERKKTVCSFDEFDYDVLHNQILKTTIGKLLRTEELNKNIKADLHKLYIRFPRISDIKIYNRYFKGIRLHRNNYQYGFLLNVCQLINENIFINEESGRYQFKDFVRDKPKMAQLFESFLRNFYKLESDYKVSGDTIRWQLTPQKTEDSKVLPLMLTDITLLKPEKKVIIDAKYYQETFKSRFTEGKMNSNHLYQIFAYLKNQEDGSSLTNTCEGVLLYPTVFEDFEYTFFYEDHEIRVVSINLNQDWKYIYIKLLSIV